MKFTKANLFIGVLVVALSAIGLNYTNCGQQLSEQDSSSGTNTATTSLTEKSETKTATEVKKDYGASTQGYADELNGRKFTLPLTGAVIHIEELAITPPKGKETKDERGCLLDIASVLDKIDIQFVLMQSKGETISVGRQMGGSASDVELLNGTQTSTGTVICKDACPYPAPSACCAVMYRGVIVDREPVSKFVLSSNIVGEPIVTESGEKFTIKKVVHTDESGREFFNECYIDLNEIGNKMNGGVPSSVTLDLIHYGSDGGYKLYVCKGPGTACVIY